MDDTRTILYVDDHVVLHPSITAFVFAGARLLAAANSENLVVPSVQQRTYHVVYRQSRCLVSEALIDATTYRVICSPTADAAAQILQDELIHTVLLDLYLDSDEISPSVEIAKLAVSKNARVCVLTADDSTTSIALLHAAGVSGFLNKSSWSIALAIGWLLDGNTLFPGSLLDGAVALRMQAESVADAQRRQADFLADEKHNLVLLDLLHKRPQKTTADKVAKSQAWVSNKIEEAMVSFGTQARGELLRRYLLAKMPEPYRAALLDALTKESQTLEEVAIRHGLNPATLRQKASEYYSAINVGNREDARQLLQSHGL